MLFFPHPTMFAPLEGLSHQAMRALIAEKGGVGAVCTEFVRIYENRPLSLSSLREEVVKTGDIPLSVQIMGNSPVQMARSAQLLSEAGADIVDINLGCPVQKVVRKGVGSAMLKDLENIFEVLSAMRKVVPKTLSAKIRSGFDSSSQVIEIGKTIEAAGADFIVIHPRRRCDFFKGVPDWGIIRMLKENLSIPVVGNGDVWYANDVMRMQKETGCDAVMIGRPAIRNPWIFQQAAELAAGKDPIEPDGNQLLAHLDDVFRRYDLFFSERTRSLLGKLKELTRYIGQALPNKRVFLQKALRSQSVDQWRKICGDFLTDRPASMLDLDAFGRNRLEESGFIK